jgi:hypothetical protein
VTRVQINPLHDYASRNWGYHVRSALIEVKQSVLGFLENEAKVSASTQAMIAIDGQSWKSKRNLMTLRRVTGV